MSPLPIVSLSFITCSGDQPCSRFAQSYHRRTGPHACCTLHARIRVCGQMMHLTDDAQTLLATLLSKTSIQCACPARQRTQQKTLEIY
jgi:uncharacterized lipoprotein YbaY